MTAQCRGKTLTLLLSGPSTPLSSSNSSTCRCLREADKHSKQTFSFPFMLTSPCCKRRLTEYTSSASTALYRADKSLECVGTSVSLFKLLELLLLMSLLKLMSLFWILLELVLLKSGRLDKLLVSDSPTDLSLFSMYKVLLSVSLLYSLLLLSSEDFILNDIFFTADLLISGYLESKLLELQLLESELLVSVVLESEVLEYDLLEYDLLESKLLESKLLESKLLVSELPPSPELLAYALLEVGLLASELLASELLELELLASELLES